MRERDPAVLCEATYRTAPVDRARSLSMADWSHRRRRAQKRAFTLSTGVTSALEYSRTANVDQFWVTSTVAFTENHSTGPKCNLVEAY